MNKFSSGIKNNSNFFLIVLFLFYCMVTIITVFRHEVWIDEAQAWLVAQKLSPLGVLKEIQIEGHPALWYFIIMPFAKLRFDVLSMQLISVFTMIFATGLLIWKSPFNFLTKLAIVLSPCYLYWLPDVARSYSLVALLIFALAIYWNRQKEHPYIFSIILILLANTHILMFALCFSVFLCFLFENLKDFCESKSFKILIPSLIQATAFFLIYMFFYVLNSGNVNDVTKAHDVVENIYYLISCFGFFTFLKPVNIQLYHFSCIVAWLLFLSLSVLLLKIDKRIFFVSFVGLLFQIYIYIFIIYVIPQRVALTLLIVVFAFWAVSVQASKKTVLFRVTEISFILFFALSVPISLNLIKGDFFNAFSSSKETAQFIKDNLGNETTFTGVGHVSSVQVYAPNIKFYSPSINRNYSFYEFDNKNFNPYLYKMTKQELRKHNIKYIVSYKILKDDFLTEVYSPDIKKFYYSDKYYIYKYNF